MDRNRGGPSEITACSTTNVDPRGGTPQTECCNIPLQTSRVGLPSTETPRVGNTDCHVKSD